MIKWHAEKLAFVPCGNKKKEGRTIEHKYHNQLTTPPTTNYKQYPLKKLSKICSSKINRKKEYNQGMSCLFFIFKTVPLYRTR